MWFLSITLYLTINGKVMIDRLPDQEMNSYKACEENADLIRKQPQPTDVKVVAVCRPGKDKQ